MSGCPNYNLNVSGVGFGGFYDLSFRLMPSLMIKFMPNISYSNVFNESFTNNYPYEPKIKVSEYPEQNETTDHLNDYLKSNINSIKTELLTYKYDKLVS